MSTAIYRTEDPDLETVDFRATYRTCAPRTDEPWTLYKISDDCGVDSIELLDVPDGWDNSYEYATGDARTWPRVAHSARDADFTHAIPEIAIVPVDNREADAGSCALLYRFVWLY